jgi:membrane AbrB-like protein
MTTIRRLLRARPLWHVILTFGLAAIGGFAAHWIGLPGGYLMGGAVAVTLGAVAGLPVGVPQPVRDGGFILTGMLMGSTVARESLVLMGQWPVTLLGLVLELTIIVLATGYMLRRGFGLDPATSYLSSFPGSMSLVAAMAEAGHGDPRQIIVIQVIRVLLLTFAVPIVALFMPLGPNAGPHAAAAVMSPVTFFLLAGACALVAFAFHRLGFPAAFVLGPMLTATVAKLAGLYDGALPEPLIIAIFLLMGVVIGSRFRGITRAELGRAAVSGLVATAMTIAIVSAVAFLCSLLVAMPFTQIWLGLAPGALESMGALGVALGYDAAFIAAHHASRMFLLAAAIPLAVWFLARAEKRVG